MGERCIFHADGRRTGKSVCRQIGSRHACHCTPARAVLDHGRMVDAAHHLAAWSVILGNAQRFACLRRRQAKLARTQRRRRQRNPCA
jgi:hypothetical protein